MLFNMHNVTKEEEKKISSFSPLDSLDVVAKA